MFKKEFFKKYLGLILSLDLLFIIFLCLSFVKTNYEIIVPGPTTDLNTIINIKNSDTDTNIYSVSVMDYNDASLLNYIIARMNKYALIEEQSEYVDTSESYQISSGTIQKNVSITNALICGYNTAYQESSPITYEFKGFIIHSLYGDASKYFQVGDVVVGYKDKTLTPTYGLSQAIFETESITELALNTDYTIKIIRNGEEMEVTAQCFEYVTDDSTRVMLGLSMYADYEITSDVSNLYSIDYPSSTGPSAGFAMALYVYDQLTNQNLTNDLTIVATGTIDIDGTVGAIGGVESKVIAASARHADYFFVPSENYDDAMASYHTINTSMKIVKVDNITDAINFLESLGTNND